MVKEFKLTYQVKTSHRDQRAVTMTVKVLAEDDVKAYTKGIEHAKTLSKELNKTVILQKVVEA